MPAKTKPVDQAVGMVLPHDITEIRPAGADHGAFKGPAFQKGHIIRPEDVERLRRLGKDRIYILTLEDNEIHENEAARLMADAMAGQGVVSSGRPTEGKLNLLAARDGLLKVNTEALYRFNLLGEVMCATLHDNTPVSKGEQVAATRLIPLIAELQLVKRAVAIARDAGGLLQVRQMRAARAGLVITGSEVFHGLIKDSFEPVLRDKLAKLGSTVARVSFAPDDAKLIAAEIAACLEDGADLIVTSGGMSVDPDDVTRAGIMQAGATDICYGTPVLPGAMFLTGRIGQVPVLGLPACGMFHKITVFDLILPRVLCGEAITREDLARLGHGGLCRNCKHCQYPVCGFGK
ncbi:MAG: molybdopterin-binding protein [Desulfobacterales bacterium]|nr:MAG: molybdopterin-binding protein [Desulfobacterales bacterium]